MPSRPAVAEVDRRLGAEVGNTHVVQRRAALDAFAAGGQDQRPEARQVLAVELVAGLAAVALVGRRRVHERRVGVAAAQASARHPRAVAARRLAQCRRVEGAGPAGGHEQAAREVADRDLDLLRPLVDRLGVLGHARVVVARLVLGPAAPVEAVEVGGLPVRRPLGGVHAQQLAAVARPVERAVVVVPAEGGRARRGGAERPALVVPPRRVAVQRRGQHERHHGHSGGHQPGVAGVADAQLLEPQEGEHEQRERGAAHELVLEVERHGGHRVERHEQGQRDAGEPDPVAARPERREGGGGHQHGAAERDHGADPLVEPAVRHAHAGQRRDAAVDAGGQRAPVVGPQQLVGDSAAEQREPERDDRHAARRDLPVPEALQPARGEQAEHRQHAGSERVQRTVGLRRVEQHHPVQRAEAGEGDERKPARDRDRQRGIARQGARGGGRRSRAHPVTPSTVGGSATLRGVTKVIPVTAARPTEASRTGITRLRPPSRRRRRCGW